jgi:pilus assembly protein CpaB
MNRLRLILLATALVAALLAAYLSAGLLGRAPDPQPAPPVAAPRNDTADVLVAARNLDQGEQLGTPALEWRAWPRNGVTEVMITKDAMPDAMDQMQQARARLPMVAGEPIVASKIVRPGERGFMSAILPGGMRAISVPISEVTAVSGFILPNDRVDVILTRKVTARNKESSTASETVLTNVKVLAINQSLKAGEDGATVPDGRTAVLELDPQQAEILTTIISSGSLTLILRSLAEGGPAGLTDDKPMLSSSFLNPRRGTSGPLIIRYGIERSMPGQ